jgi:hypothetical protein
MVIAGLDTCIQGRHQRDDPEWRRMDRRVKPGNDERRGLIEIGGN